ncbi:28S ribosomal protein S29, mitochondrial [Danio aesculapii]|uniref:28S ribosomal protein S29, mitochondrial n=1 Tax=Danio aesculapii TaxID=1142201 RepID=UPI0024C01915|nr:28S ribosomal protein S29, mitochondrial [Danio aesculapii]
MNLHKLSLRLRPAVTQKFRCLSIQSSGQELEAVAAETPSVEPNLLSVFRTSEQDPTCHSETHSGQYYTLPPTHIQKLFPHGLPPRFQMQVRTFNEGCVMVRPAALELISYLKKADYSKPPLRYILYGETGSGKSLSLCHTLHYCYTQGWLILHVPDAHLWVKNCKEMLPSTYNPSRFDQPVQATQWLKSFKITNEHFLSKIKTTRRYVWTKRESTEEGRPLGELVDQGVNRMKSSSDVVGAVLRELRLQAGAATEGEEVFKLAVAVDGVNALWGNTTLKKEDRTMCEPEELTLIHNLRKMMKTDWRGGAILTALSQTGSLFKPRSAYLPSELLGEDGFDQMEPFVPVCVSGYNEKEFESCYLYYLDRNWLQHPHSRSEEGKKELIFLSNRNPSILERLCAFL